ncbi:MAG: hypothetical protein CM1200mP14_25170 [Gammaproteobacteria bacterium]|nr:MAG: hypothetical protein CM1200mP14_25170 [Gammaproteobacteria bacterium]
MDNFPGRPGNLFQLGNFGPFFLPVVSKTSFNGRAPLAIIFLVLLLISAIGSLLFAEVTAHPALLRATSEPFGVALVVNVEPVLLLYLDKGEVSDFATDLTCLSRACGCFPHIPLQVVLF